MIGYSKDEQPAKPVVKEIEEKKSSTIDRTNNQLYFYSDIDEDSSLKINRELKAAEIENLNLQNSLGIENPIPIYLHIQTPGGYVTSSFSIADCIQSIRVPVITVIEGLCASGGTIMSIVGTQRWMQKNAVFLIHQLAGGNWGKFSELRDGMLRAEKQMTMIKKHYRSYSKMPPKVMEELLNRDLYLSAEETLKYGFVDKIV